jgi:PAS domain S-box-containing protein
MNLCQKAVGAKARLSFSLDGESDRYGQLFQQTLDALEDLILIKGPDSRLLWANEKMRSYYGMSVEDIRGIVDAPFVEADLTLQYVKDDQYVFNTGKVLEIAEEKITRHDGVTLPFTTTKSPIFGSDGNVVMIAVICRDISRQKELENQRDRLLASEKVARKVAEDANRMKDDFLAVLSHELRTPLTTILGWVQELRLSKEIPRSVADGLAKVEHSALVQGQLINDLLDISRIHAGKLSIDVKVINLVEVVILALESVRNLATKKFITIESDFLSERCMVFADATRTQQVFWNLLTNAIKFTPPGGKIFVSLDTIEGQTEQLAQVQITDTGIGVKAEFLLRIFERFSQEDSSITRLYGGLGLGLTLVKSLVEMQAGSVTAESPGEGMGATFTVTLPIVPAENTVPLAPPPSEPQNGQAQLDGVRVLVVDDDACNRELFSVILNSFGAEVRLADSAGKVMQIWTEFKPDILISDISMPEEDGYSLIRKVRALDAAAGGRIPAIALTAYASAEDVRNVMLAGFSAHVAKPVDRATLRDVVVRLLNKSKTTALHQ